MAGQVLYSTNPFMSFDLCERYRNGVQPVWCSEFFDPRKQPGLSIGSMVAPTSSPAALARSLLSEVNAEDRHSDHIRRYKRTFRLLANAWQAAGDITPSDAQTIRDLMKITSWKPWRPLVYLIPRAHIEAAGRLKLVPTRQSAGHGLEYRIMDLNSSEFDVLEWENA